MYKITGGCGAHARFGCIPCYCAPNDLFISQWPDESLLPGFRSSYERYLAQVKALSFTFISLLAESFGLPPDAFDRFYDTDDKIQHRSDIIQYPVVTDLDASDQGIGPHYDGSFLTFASSLWLSMPINMLTTCFCIAPPSIRAQRPSGPKPLRQVD